MMPPRTNETGSDQVPMPPNPDQKWIALTTLGIIITAILTIVQGSQRRHNTINPVPDKATTALRAKDQKR